MFEMSKGSGEGGQESAQLAKVHTGYSKVERGKQKISGTEKIKSPLRYPGGKSKALKEILPLIPEFTEYREPMVGGGSIFFLH